MRRLWMSLLLAPIVAVAVPTAALASLSAPAARAAPPRRSAPCSLA